MKTAGLVCLLLSAVLMRAQGEAFRTDINPALLYYRAFLIPTEPISDADRTYLASRKGREQKLPERFGRIVAGSEHQFTLVRQAAQATVPCDWGIDLSSGPNILLPHLGRAKAVAQMAQLRAVWALQQGRPDEAREDLLAAFILGRNTASDNFLIGVLVQHVIETMTYETMAQHFGELSPELLQQLVDGFDAAPARRTVADCMPGEKTCFYDWMLTRIQELQRTHPQDDAKVMAGFRECGIVTAMEFSGYTNFWPRLVAASGGTSEGVIRLLREEEPFFARIAKIMVAPQPEYEAQVRRLLEDTRQSQNPFFPLLNSYFTGFSTGAQKYQVRVREFRVQAQSAMVRAAAEYRQHGEDGWKRVMDPFGNGPFSCRRFVLKGVDRGIELRSAYAGAEAPLVMIFVEKPGAPFEVTGPNAGKPVDK